MKKAKIKKVLLTILILLGIWFTVLIVLCTDTYLDMRKKCNEDQTLVSPTGNYVAEIDNFYYSFYWGTISDVTVKSSDGITVIKFNGEPGADFYWSKNTDVFWMLSRDTGTYVYLIEDNKYTEYNVKKDGDKFYLENKNEDIEYNINEIPDSIIDYLNAYSE